MLDYVPFGSAMFTPLSSTRINIVMKYIRPGPLSSHVVENRGIALKRSPSKQSPKRIL